MTKRYTYTGDVNIEDGGTWFDLSTFGEGYVDAVQVTPLDSAIGWRGAYCIEQCTVCIDADKWPKQIDVCGLEVTPDGKLTDGRDSWAIDEPRARLLIADAVLAYGYSDRDSSLTVVVGRDAESSFDGWESDERLRKNVNLRRWIMDHFNIVEG